MLAEGAGHWTHLRARSLRQPGYCPPSRLTPRTSPEAPADSGVGRCHTFVDLMLFFIGLVARRGTLLPTWASQVLRQERVRLPMQETQEMQVPSLGREDALEEDMAPHSSILAWRTPGTEEPGGLRHKGSDMTQ